MRAAGSRPAVGSSSSSTGGSWTSARARNSRCCTPRDSVPQPSLALGVEIDEPDDRVDAPLALGRRNGVGRGGVHQELFDA